MATKAKKRKISEEEESVQALTAKRRFNAKQKDLRSLLQTPNDEIRGVLEDFLLLLKHPSHATDTAIAFFADGGSCLEIFQQLDQPDIQTHCSLPLEIASLLIQHVTADAAHIHLVQPTAEGCRYLLNSHLPLLQTLCSSNSVSNAQRHAALTLFTSIIHLDPSFAKVILKGVKFNMLLYMRQHLAHASHVRLAFINFVVALLVDSEAGGSLSLLVHTKHLFSAVISGLQFDSHACVTNVLSSLQHHLISHPRISKSLKMKVFTTPTMQQLVRLYDWKGPTCYDTRTRRPIDGAVNLEHRASIARMTHACLLPLCTSTTSGIIFKDELLGSGRDHRNPLLASVLDAITVDQLFGSALLAELVVRACAAAPDLVRPVWTKLLVNLEPRDADNWYAAMAFARHLLRAMDADVSIGRAHALSALQHAQIVQMHVTPAPVLQTMLAMGVATLPTSRMRVEILRTLRSIADGVRRYLTAAKEALRVNYFRVLRTLLVDHLERHLPAADALTQHWLQHQDSAVDVLHLLDAYAQVAPSLLAQLHFDDVPAILQAEQLGDEFRALFLRFLLAHDARHLAVDAALFPSVAHALTKAMRCNEPDVAAIARQTFEALLLRTGLFDAAGVWKRHEVALWVDVTQHKHAAAYLVNCLRAAHAHAPDLQREFNALFASCDLRSGDAIDDEERVAAILSRLQHDVVSLLPAEMDGGVVRMRFSLVTLLCVRHLCDAHRKIVAHVVDALTALFHLQTEIRPFQALIAAHERHLPAQFANYVLQYESAIYADDVTLPAVKRIASAICRLTQSERVVDEGEYQLLVTAVKDAMTDAGHAHLVYGHPKLLDAFMQPPDGVRTRFVLDVTAHLRNAANMDDYFAPFWRKLHRIVMQDSSLTAWRSSSFEQIVGLIASGECVRMLAEMAQDVDGVDQLRYKLIVAMLQRLADDEQVAPSCGGQLYPLAAILNQMNAANGDSAQLAHALHANWTRYFANIGAGLKMQLCEHILRRAEFCKRNADLMMHVLTNDDRDGDVLTYLLQSHDAIEVICAKKGHALPILDLLYVGKVERAACETTALQFYAQMSPHIGRVLAKPQKAGAHFATHYAGLCALIERCMSLEEIGALGVLDKAHKCADAGDVFVAALISAICCRCATLATDSMCSRATNAVISIANVMVAMFKRREKMADEGGQQLDDVLAAGEYLVRLMTVLRKRKDVNLDALHTHDAFWTLHKFCLQFGVSTIEGDTALLTVLRSVAESGACAYTHAQLDELNEQMRAHPTFVRVALAAPSSGKQRMFELAGAWATRQPSIMRKEHVPQLLAAYSATCHPCDAAVLRLIRMYEARPQQTHFYDFRPFLWGAHAHHFYGSARGGGGGAWQQRARVADVLQCVDVDLIRHTIGRPVEEEGEDDGGRGYDVSFVLCVLSQLLAPESVVETWRFTRAGVLALVAHALSRPERALRMAASHVVGRFYCHLQAERGGKEHMLWERYVNALAHGCGDVSKRPLNGFAGVFMARAALVLADAQHEMYAPLNNFLGVKVAPTLTGVPEVYAFLHASGVSHGARRAFILDVLADGMRSEGDFEVAVKGNVLKLAMCMHDSHVCDVETRKRVLRVVRAATRMRSAARKLCDAHALIGWLHLHASKCAKMDGETCALMAAIVRNLCAHYEDGTSDGDSGAIRLLTQLRTDFDALCNRTNVVVD